MKELCLRALDIAKEKDVSFADIRIVKHHTQIVTTEDERVSGIQDSESMGFGVRVLLNGCWGFAASKNLFRKEIEDVTLKAVEIARASSLAKMGSGVVFAPEEPHEDIFRTPVQKDPFKVPIEEKVNLLLGVNKEMLRVRGVKKAHSFMWFKSEERYLANTDGSFIESNTCTSTAECIATAVDEHTAKTRYFEAIPVNAGYEHIEGTPLLKEAQRVGEEAVAHLTAKECPQGKKDLILHPSHLALTIHESIGHALELDRVLGMEESLAGSSFATIDKLGKLKYGSPIVNIVCDNTDPTRLASKGYDDDGVPGQRWYIIKNGILVDYQTGREVCHTIGAEQSRGSCRADSWQSIPIIRQSNIGLEPGEEPLTLEELIADTKDGIYIEGMGSFSIDQKRVNFQFGGDCFWEIKNGKKTCMLKDVTYQAITTDFWGSCDAICDKRFWQPYGVLNCGKGDPMQIAQMTHGSSPVRFRNINVGGAKL